MPPLTSSLSAVFANLQITLAGAVASSVEIASALERKIHHCVLIDLVVDSRFTKLFTKFRILFYRKAAVINKNNGLRIFNRCGNFLDDRFLQFNFCHFIYLLIDFTPSPLCRLSKSKGNIKNRRPVAA